MEEVFSYVMLGAFFFAIARHLWWKPYGREWWYDRGGRDWTLRLMSILTTRGTEKEDERLVQVPVRSSRTEDQYPTDGDTDLPDTDQQRPGTVSISRHPTDLELLAYLATIRTEEGRYRLSANNIFACLGGTRADVMTRIRDLRATGPEQEPRFRERDGSTGPGTYPVSRRNGGHS